MRPLIPSALCLALAPAALAQDLPDGVGIAMPNGSVFTTEISQGDVDDYVVDGYPGMTLTATVAPAHRSQLVAHLQVLRPDGSVAADTRGWTPASGRPKGASLRVTFDATGPWKVRVSGTIYDLGDGALSVTSGAYSVRVRTTRARLDPVVVASADASGQLRFTIPGQGGARIGYSATGTGGPLEFRSFIDPLGRPVAAFPGGASVKSFLLPRDLPLGDHTLTFDAPVTTTTATLRRTLVLPSPSRKRAARLSTEPTMLTDRLDGGPGGAVEVKVSVRAHEALLSPLVSADEHFEGDALAVGDVTGDGLLDYVVSRSSPVHPGPSTRILSTVK